MCRLFFFFLFLLPCCVLHAEDPKKEIKLLWDGPYSFSVKKDSDTILIPVALPDNFSLKGISCSFNGTNSLAAKLGGSFQTDTAKNTAFILAVHDIALLNTDTYTVFLLLQQAESKLQQTIRLTIVIKPAAVSVTPVATVIRTYSFWGMGYSEDKTNLLVYETSGETSLASYSIHTNSSQLTAKNEPGGTLVFSDKPQIVAPLRDEKIDYSITGDFPFGKTTGKYEVRSPRLSAPLPIQIDVYTKLGAFFLFLYIFSGLIVSYFFKVFLASDLDLSKAKLAASELVQRMKQEMAQRPDLPFQQTIAALSSQLSAALTFSKAADVTTAATTAEAGLKSAIEDYNSRNKSLKVSLDAADKIVHAKWTVPSNFEPILVTASQLLAGATANYKAGNIDAGSTKMQEYDNYITQQLFAASLIYRRQLTTDLFVISNSRFSIPGLAEPLSAVQAAINAMTASAIGAEPFKLLQEAEAVNYAAAKLFNYLTAKTIDLINAVLVNYKESTLIFPDSNAIAKLATNANAMNLQWQQVNGSDEAIHVFSNSLDPLYLLLRDALMNQVTFQNKDEAKEKENILSRAQILTALKSGQTPEASAAVITFLKDNDVARYAKIDPLNPPPDNRLSFKKLEQPAKTDNKEGQGIEDHSVDSVPKDDTTPENLRKRIFLETALQTAFSGLGVILVGFVIYKDGFNGGVADFAGIFLWALGIDLSLSTLTGLGAKLPKS